jgi:hypothetical protein
MNNAQLNVENPLGDFQILLCFAHICSVLRSKTFLQLLIVNSKLLIQSALRFGTGA